MQQTLILDRQRLITFGMIGLYFLALIFLSGGSSRTALAQSYWSAPSYAPTPELGQCFDDLSRYYGNTREIYERQLDSAIRTADSDENIALLVVAGTATAIALYSGPWAPTVLVAGLISAAVIVEYYNNVRAGHRSDFSSKVSALNSAADAAAADCENTHLNGGDPENEADENPGRNGGGGFSIPGGTQSIGVPRGTVTVQPAN